MANEPPKRASGPINQPDTALIAKLFDTISARSDDLEYKDVCAHVIEQFNHVQSADNKPFRQPASIQKKLDALVTGTSGLISGTFSALSALMLQKKQNGFCHQAQSAHGKLHLQRRKAGFVQLHSSSVKE